MPRSIWTGAISFGMVTVPVKLYSAINRKNVRFHQLNGKDGVRIAQKRVDPQSGEEVPFENIVKGYEIAQDRYVVIEPGELEALAPKKTKTIEIEDFVELVQIDPIYYDHPYYLAPGPGGAKPYRLLLDAMSETGKVAIARVVIRSKEQLVALRPMGDALGMATMIFADEVQPPESIEEIAEVKEIKTTKRELEIAKQLVESLAGDFQPERYTDSYREQILDMIERKAQGEQIAVQPEPEDLTAPAPDLMGALKASLEAVRAREDEDGAKPKAAKRKAAAKKTPAKAAAGKSAGKKGSGSGSGSKRSSSRATAKS
jgi:DNA end-binding protein Ku